MGDVRVGYLAIIASDQPVERERGVGPIPVGTSRAPPCVVDLGVDEARLISGIADVGHFQDLIARVGVE